MIILGRGTQKASKMLRNYFFKLGEMMIGWRERERLENFILLLFFKSVPISFGYRTF